MSTVVVVKVTLFIVSQDSQSDMKAFAHCECPNNEIYPEAEELQEEPSYL